MTWNTGDMVELNLSGFAHDGRAVARQEGKPVVFTQGGLPGQRVRVELTAVKKRMAEGVTRETLATVPGSMGGERPAPCPHAAECGGCPWQCLPYPEQLRWKHQLVSDSLTRVGGLTLPEGLLRPVLPSPAPTADNAGLSLFSGEWGYRNKMEFAFAPNAAHPGEAPLLGLRRRASREVTEVTGCLLQTPRTMEVLAALRGLAGQSGLPARDGTKEQNGALRFAVIREPGRKSGHEPGFQRSGHSPCVAEIITGPGDADAFLAVRTMGQSLLAGPWGVTGFVHSVRTAAADVAYGEKTVFTCGDTGLTETLRLAGHAAPVTFELGHNAFFQVNTAATELLYNTAAALAFANQDKTQKNCWDVYCGVGGLTLTFAPHFSRVLGLENMASAVTLARRNATSFPQCRFETADAARLGEYFRRYGVPDLLSADPPRAGLDERAVKAILQALPPRLLLVSCNPATLARDLAALTTAYKPLAIQPVDLFPQTHHVETIAVLERLAVTPAPHASAATH